MPVAAGVCGLKAQGLAVLEHHGSLEEPRVMGFGEFPDLDPVQGVNGQRVSPVDKGADHEAPPNLVQAKDGERVRVLANDKGVNFSLV